MSMTKTVATYGSLVRLSHTVFALPFALAAIVLAAPYAEITLEKVALIVLCIACARTAAMAFNRLIDRDIDARNPRTRDRELPRGLLSAAALLYASACGGPYGTEDFVARSGPGLLILLQVLAAGLWGIPLALATAELSARRRCSGTAARLMMFRCNSSSVLPATFRHSTPPTTAPPRPTRAPQSPLPAYSRPPRRNTPAAIQ